MLRSNGLVYGSCDGIPTGLSVASFVAFIFGTWIAMLKNKVIVCNSADTSMIRRRYIETWKVFGHDGIG